MNSGIPAVHVLHFLEVVAPWGIGAGELLGGLDVNVSALQDPRSRISIPVIDQIASRARDLTGEPALGVLLGKQMRASAHGYLGFAAMMASNIREALDLAVRFAPTRTRALSLRVLADDDQCAVVISERLHPYPAAREIIVFTLTAGLMQIGEALSGVALKGSADFAFEMPQGFEASEAGAPYEGRIRFGQSANQLVFPTSVLDLPIVGADVAARRLAEEQCERELDRLVERSDLLLEVSSLIPKAAGGFRSLEETAALIGVSPRTLKRRLAERGSSYSTLLEQHQRDRAVALLRSRNISLEAIAEQLDYSDLANFTRAFRRWTGVTPGAFRRNRGGT